ncbi:MAG: ParB/RepB/Spo0J family partition protein [Lautropia sp.]|nr:ParB/RepB/Spo0J family partition protein [Lautropia sp.]
MSKKTKGGLGRGLDSLLGGDSPLITGTPEPAVSPLTVSEQATNGGDQGIQEMSLNLLQAGRYQPRSRMDESALQELADSIHEHGLLQPLVIRPIQNGRYEIIAGERRFRAAALAHLERVPVIIKEVSDENALALALIENIQREDLNPLEEASAIQRLIDEFHYTHEQAAQAIGRSRSATTNLLRLLNLADTVQTMLLAGDIEMGHARCLLSLDRAEQILMAHLVVQRRLSVRETEKMVNQKLEENKSKGHPAPRRGADTITDRDVARLRERIADHLNTTVEIVSKANGRGKLVIHFSSNDAFTGLLERLKLDSVTQE